MKKLLTYLILLFLAQLAIQAVAQQPVEEWVRRYNGPADSYDGASALAVDGDGNVYVTGHSWGSGTDRDYATIKYDPDGNEEWVSRYNGPANATDYPIALAVDGGGNVYVTGTSVGSGTDRDYATIKYDPNGNEVWVRRYNGPADSYDGASALAVDGDGNVYVTGTTTVFKYDPYGNAVGYGGHCATIKYDPNGNEVWVRRYNDSYYHPEDAGTALAVDGGGNVYVTGYSHGSDTKNSDYATIKYDPDGNEEWVSRYNGPANNTDAATALAVDGGGNVYVTGQSKGSGTGYDYATIKYDPDGNEEWVRRYNGPANATDYPIALAVDGGGNVYVTGYSDGSGTGYDYDYATIKYDPDGNEEWVSRYNGPVDYTDRPTALAADGGGNVYVTGHSWGSGYDYATIKYDPDGNEEWVSRYNGPVDSFDAATALAVDGDGNVYVTGASNGSGYVSGYATIKYSQNVQDTDGDGVSDGMDNAPDDFNPDQLDIDGDGVGDVADPCPSDPINTCDPDRSAAVYVSKDEGGVLTTPDGSVSITIPAGAMDDDRSISITDANSEILGFKLPTNRGTVVGIFSVYLHPSGISFSSPVKIVFSWDDDDNDGIVDGTNAKEDDLIIIWDNQVIAGKCKDDPDCDKTANTFTFEVMHFSEFTLAYVTEPVVDSITVPMEPVNINQPITASGSFTDADDDDTHTATWDWGDGTTSDGTVNQQDNTISGKHTYAEPGVYTVKLTVQDSFPNVGESPGEFVVIYDPDGGFVTGGGWIDSPAGAYIPDPSLAGKANFGFVSKYKKGATVPTGNTEFRFKAGDLNFQSDSYDWLVIARHKAQYKGVGTINGNGNYGFMLFAVDANLTPSTDVDRFRIKIWDRDMGDAVVYDNEMWAAEDTQPTTNISGGSIVIHTK